MIRSGDRPASREPRVPNTLRWGVGLAFGAALISGFSIFVNGFAVKQLPDPAVYTTLKNGIAAAILAAIAAGLVRGDSIRRLDRRSWAGLAVVGVVGGSIPFLLFFAGLAQASAPSAAFIQKTLFAWVAVLAVPLLRERLGWGQLAALGVLLAGQFLVAPPSGVVWGTGETMIAIATLFWAVEVVIAKRLLASVPAPVVGVGRMAIGLVVLVGYLVATGKLSSIIELSGTQWSWALATGAILAGYVTTWFAALQRAPASLVTAVLVVGAPITAVFQSLGQGALPTGPVLAGEALILVAALALSARAFRARLAAGTAAA
jgi:drug/metabolite transporter (DMT)-like permease